MLARGLLRRVAVTVPKTTTNDLPQLARLLQRIALAPNASPLSAAPAVSRGLSAAIAEFRRSYATTTEATKPTKTVKKAVKKTAAKKTATKKAASKKTAKKAAPKKKKKAAAAKKKAAPRRKKKELTAEEKGKEAIRELKRKALRMPVKGRGIRPVHVIMKELSAGKKGLTIQDIQRESLAKVEGLSPAELEHYNHLANQENAARKKQYEDWVHSHDPIVIRTANRARAKLRKLLTVKATTYTQKIHDDRDKRGPTGYMKFVSERWASGDMKGLTPPESSKLISREWKALNESEKKKYSEA